MRLKDAYIISPREEIIAQQLLDQNQPLLLQLFNSKFGRTILGLPQNAPFVKRLKFTTYNGFCKDLLMALSSLEIIRKLEIKDEFSALLHFLNLIPRPNKYPMVMHAELLGTSLFNDANLKEYWTLEDRFADKNANDLTEVNAPTYTAAKYNNGANFGSANTNKGLNTASTFAIDGGIISLVLHVKLLAEIGSGVWMFMEHAQAGTFHIDYRLGYDFNAGTRQLFVSRAKSGVGSDTATYNIALGTADFYHLGLVYNNTNCLLYVNGVQQASVAASGMGTSAPAQTGVGIGYRISNSGDQFSSTLCDDAAIFNKALSVSELGTLSNPATAAGMLASAEI